MFLESWREGIEFLLGDVVFGIIFPYYAADIAQGDPTVIVDDGAPRAELGDDDEVCDAR